MYTRLLSALKTFKERAKTAEKKSMNHRERLGLWPLYLLGINAN